MSPCLAVPPQADSRQAGTRRVVALALMTIGGSVMYVVCVVLPAVREEFGVARADASLEYTLLMIGFGIGGIFMGRLAARRGVMWPSLIGAADLGVGFVVAGQSRDITSFALVHGLLLGLVDCSATSYHAAFLNGIDWSAVNLSVVLFLFGRTRGWIGRRALAA